MRKPILAVLPIAILALSILACAKASPEQIRKFTATPSVTPTATQPSPTATRLPVSTPAPILAVTSTPDPFGEISILAVFLNVRDQPDGLPTGLTLKQGDTARALCTGTWCELESGGFVWRGCTSNNPDGLGCAER